MNKNISDLMDDLFEADNTKTALFYNDVIKGLRENPKHLDSKYFYDAAGDKLFREIMNCPEYYLTRAELEIFSEKTVELAAALSRDRDSFDLIELGAGDATKSTYLLKELLGQQMDFRYIPIDISANVIENLNESLPKVLPRLKLTGLNGEYFEMLEKATSLSNRPKVVLFLGSNIGNMPVDRVTEFC